MKGGGGRREGVGVRNERGGASRAEAPPSPPSGLVQSFLRDAGQDTPKHVPLPY